MRLGPSAWWSALRHNALGGEAADPGGDRAQEDRERHCAKKQDDGAMARPTGQQSEYDDPDTCGEEMQREREWHSRRLWPVAGPVHCPPLEPCETRLRERVPEVLPHGQIMLSPFRAAVIGHRSPMPTVLAGVPPADKTEHRQGRRSARVT